MRQRAAQGERRGIKRIVDLGPVERRRNPRARPRSRRQRRDGRRVAVSDLVIRYNDIIDEVETDPSLKIEVRQ